MTRIVLTLFFIGLLVCKPAMAAEPVTYYVPPSQFNAAIEVMEGGFSNLFALFQNATASFNFDETGKSISRLRIAIDTSSLLANNPSNQEELNTLIGAGQFTEIRITDPDSVAFTDGKADVKADVTLHGVTKPVTLQATLNHIGKSPAGGSLFSSEGDAVGLSLTGSLKRADFGMGDDPSAASASRFGDSLTLRLEMQAIKQ